MASPVVLGELLVGAAARADRVGDAARADPTFAFLADLGFALIMFVAGSHVPVRDAALRAGLVTGALRALVVGLLAVAFGIGIAHLFGTGHAVLYAVLIASSSAALVLPIRDSLSCRTGRAELLAQVAVADTMCIVALPLAIDPAHAGRAALGQSPCWRARSRIRGAPRTRATRPAQTPAQGLRTPQVRLELRINLVILFALAALAVNMHVSIMLAGFSFGLAVAGVGGPAAWRANCSPSPKDSSARCSSSGSVRRSICATWAITRR